MPNLNKVLLMGNLTRDPEVKYLASGMAVAGFGIAINRSWKDEKSGEKREEVTFVDCECWGKSAEVLAKYFSKGSAIFVEGRLKLDQWTDKESGAKRSKLKVACERIQFAGAKPAGGGAAAAGGPQTSVEVPDDVPGDAIPF